MPARIHLTRRAVAAAFPAAVPNIPPGPVGLGGGGGGAGGGGGGAGGGGGGGAGGGANVASSGVPPRNERRYVPDEVIAEFSSTATPQSIDQLARRYNLTRLESQSFPLIGTIIYRWHINGRRSVRIQSVRSKTSASSPEHSPITFSRCKQTPQPRRQKPAATIRPNTPSASCTSNARIKSRPGKTFRLP